MSFLFHFGDLLLDGKEPVDDSVDKIVTFLFTQPAFPVVCLTRSNIYSFRFYGGWLQHRRCTIVFLLLLSLPLFTKQFAGEPIECFTPTYFTEAQSRYVNSYCWTVSTFYLDQNQQQPTQLHSPASSSGAQSKRTSYDAEYGSGRVHSIDYVDEYEIPSNMQPQQPGRRVQVKVSYYQWAPMILLAKAITFYVPFALWKALARRRGISLRQLMKRITRLSQLSPSHPDRPTLLHEILEQIHVLVRGTNRCNPSSAMNKPQHTSAIKLTMQQSRLFITFLFIKILYLLNDLLQFYLLVTFLGDDYLTHGWEIIRHLWTKSQWWTSPRFPLQTSVYIFIYYSCVDQLWLAVWCYTIHLGMLFTDYALSELRNKDPSGFTSAIASCQLIYSTRKSVQFGGFILWHCYLSQWQAWRYGATETAGLHLGSNLSNTTYCPASTAKRTNVCDSAVDRSLSTIWVVTASLSCDWSRLITAARRWEQSSRNFTDAAVIFKPPVILRLTQQWLSRRSQLLFHR